MQDMLALDGNIFRHAQRHRKSFGGRDHGVSDSSISAGGIEQRFAGAEFSAGTGLGDDVRSGAVFYRSAGVVPLGFAQQFDSGQVASEPFESQQWSIANQFEAAPAEQTRMIRRARSRCSGRRIRHFRRFG